MPALCVHLLLCMRVSCVYSESNYFVGAHMSVSCCCTCLSCVCVCAFTCLSLRVSHSGFIPGHYNSTWMAAKNDRVVRREQEELPTSGSGALTHTRSQSHIQFHPVTHTTQWQTPRALAHTRSHSHTHFSTVSHTQPQRYGCRLTHSLSAMTKGERGAHVSAGKLIKPTEPLFPKSPQQVRSDHLVLCVLWTCLDPCCKQFGSKLLDVIGWKNRSGFDLFCLSRWDLISCSFFPVNSNPQTDGSLHNSWLFSFEERLHTFLG